MKILLNKVELIFSLSSFVSFCFEINHEVCNVYRVCIFFLRVSIDLHNRMIPRCCCSAHHCRRFFCPNDNVCPSDNVCPNDNVCLICSVFPNRFHLLLVRLGRALRLSSCRDGNASRAVDHSQLIHLNLL